MKIQAALIHWSRGENLGLYWKFFWWRKQCSVRIVRDMLTFFLNRIAHRHGGYIGNGAKFDSKPILPHGLHGVYISRYAHIGADCWIYQNVTIGSVDRKAPQIGDHCLIGAGAVVIGGICKNWSWCGGLYGCAEPFNRSVSTFKNHCQGGAGA